MLHHSIRNAACVFSVCPENLKLGNTTMIERIDMSVLSKQINVPGICDVACLKKLEFLLGKSFSMTKDSSVPSHMRFKAQLSRVGVPREVHIEVFANSNTVIKASPEVRPLFNEIYDEIEVMLKESVNFLSKQDNVRTNRARRIKEYMESFSVEDEVQRIVIVTLCDVILDLIVTEKLSRFTSRPESLENDSVGAKLGMLEKQFKIPLYKPKAIRDIRELRNKVAHGGATTARDEAAFAKEATLDIFELF